ncbi:non-ribosomal peptide synthetase [Streptomyces hyaluromycini]|uniref:non-ribosomal peptide synthetase n=1 Tax=Streptomyces hyaluromycini TaxID=1377993 RepID=UPI000B5C8AD9|nr:non-ribosomal peptide synthetase [Streptomyces hyaluromycini]
MIHQYAQAPEIPRHNDTQPPTDQTIVELFDRQSDRTPKAIALVCAAERLTYAELNARANRVAHHLRSLGAKPGDLVGVCLERSADMVVAVLGVLKSGAAYVPLAPEQPEQRLETTAAAAGLCTVVTRERLAGHFTRLRLQPVVWEHGFADAPAHRPHGLPAPADLAYVIHTSGSTGAPKGVAVEHRGLVASTLARQSWYRSPPGAFLLLSPLSFDSSVAGVFWTLTTGGRLVVAEEGFWQRIDELVGALGELGVTHLLCVPSLYRAILDAAPTGDLRSLDTVIIAGEACPAPLIQRHHTVLPSARLVNEYGPTESTVWSTACEIGREWADGPVPIGKPVGHVTVYLVDELLQLVPQGVVGEILIGGNGVARGYQGHTALTAERFVADPFGTQPGGRLYRTGDLARYREDGALEFLGRADHQIKVNGVRIELGEIEAALTGHPGIREAVVLASDGARETVSQLTAYAATQAGIEVTVPGLLAYLTARLPDYMVPNACVLVADLPRNGNGKVDRAALPLLQRADTPAVGTHALSAAERAIAEIWADVLGLPLSSIGPDRNFFDAGGRSLLLLRVRRLIEQRFGRPVAVTSLLAHPTVSSLADHLAGPAGQEPDRATQRKGGGRTSARPRRRQERRAR